VALPPAIPLSGWADRQLRALADATGAPGIAALTGGGLLGERAALNRFCVPGVVSAGGGCRLYAARGGYVALSLARPDDRALLPALFGDADLNPDDDSAIAARMAASDAPSLVARGAELGLAIAAEQEVLPSPAWEITCPGLPTERTKSRTPLIIDLSALWAGPLATHLLQLAGATVLKVESPARPDAMRSGDPAFFNLLNQGKASIALTLREQGGRAALVALIRKADIVVEASRPRALLQLGIDADALVAESGGLVWISITGHGVRRGAANRIGFGDDCGVAAGLSAALRATSGTTGFVGDAIADPLTGITAARVAWDHWVSGTGARITFSMSGVVAAALADERARDKGALEDDLRAWAARRGQSFPSTVARPAGTARSFGADTREWRGELSSC
jgi:CoA-transferase family III